MWVGFAKIQCVEGKGCNNAQNEMTGGTVGWHIDLAFSIRKVALTSDFSVQCIFSTPEIQRQCP